VKLSPSPLAMHVRLTAAVQGRSVDKHMNLSRWQTYDDSEKRLMLAQIGVMVRNHVMPPRRYTLIHPEAKLSEAEVNSIYRWTHVDRGLPSHSPEE
jgi:hypothetical protein